MSLDSSRNVEITHLPNELLECILLKLSYAEITKVRQVCRRFRDVADGILDRGFRNLKARAESRLATLLQEENALRGTGSTGAAESDSAPRTRRRLPSQIDSRKLLDAICNEIRLLRAVCYRPLFLSEVPQVVRLSSAYFKGEVIDTTHRILRLLRSRWVESKAVRVDINTFINFVDHWMYLFYKKLSRY
jgi:hypothetical protein